jgi:hypothetical protein
MFRNFEHISMLEEALADITIKVEDTKIERLRLVVVENELRKQKLGLELKIREYHEFMARSRLPAVKPKFKRQNALQRGQPPPISSSSSEEVSDGSDDDDDSDMSHDASD